MEKQTKKETTVIKIDIDLTLFNKKLKYIKNELSKLEKRITKCVKNKI
jgi:hypothetical protein